MEGREKAGSVGLEDVARALTSLARRWMLIALAEQELCAADLCALLGFERHAVSKHLKVLKTCGFIQERPDDRRKMLSLNGFIRVERMPGLASITGLAGDGGEVVFRFALPKAVEQRFDHYFNSTVRLLAATD